ncbi:MULTISPECIES: amidohydrolase [Clostridium]|uniref:amidohydrolase n=1 Tax=Clostridium TaxID=1485 RepID=UPI0008258ACB|nr:MULTISPECIES: amidohydrolase [Clostridium]PJI07296.1 amidohydrolase [Clostridium sp. CT7]
MLLIKNGKIMTMANDNYEKGCILIEKGKIVEVAENIKESENMEVIDASNLTVMPGIIDAHCHIGIDEQDIGNVGLDINEIANPVTPDLKAIDAVNPMDSAFKDAVMAGVTGVMTGPGSANVIGGQFVFMKTFGKCIDNMVVLEPAAVKAAFGENPKRVYGRKGKSPVTRMAIAGLLREVLTNAQNYRYKKISAEAKGENFDKNLKMEALIPVIDGKIPLKIHAHRADDILTAIRIGKEFNLKITLDHCTEGHLISDEIKNSGFPVLVGPLMSSRSKSELLNKTLKTPGILSSEGIKTAIITDHPVVPIQYLSLCAGLSVREGMKMEEAFKAITINAAEICGVDNRVGSIEKGKDADIAIFNDNPMDTFTKTIYTIIDGNIVYKCEGY